MISITSGPQPANVLILGGYPNDKSFKAQQPFRGTSGTELSSMLNEAGFLQTYCRMTYVTSYLPSGGNIASFFPAEKQLRGGEVYQNGRYCSTEIQQGLMNLQREIARTKPKIIIALGDTALWALTGEWSAAKWRGSLLMHESGAWIIPTYDPSQILRMWSWRYIMVQDLRRAHAQLNDPVTEPAWEFCIEPSFEETIQHLNELYRVLEYSHSVEENPLYLAVDIETRYGHIDCIGIAWSSTDAISIPFCTMLNGHYWELDEEAQILQLLRKVLTHKNAHVIGQNFHYDAMYFAKHYGWYPTPGFDTMIAQGVLFPGLPKSLDFLSSLYLPYHRYWKDESKVADTKVDDRLRWEYNCKDCCVTWELTDHLERALWKENLFTPFRFEMDLFDPLMVMMMRGTRINTELRSEYSLSLLDELTAHAQWFHKLGAGVWMSEELVKSKTASAWYDSPTQQRKIFYNLLGMPSVRNRKTGRPTVDDEALKTFARREPLMIPIVRRMLEYRSLGVFYSTFVSANLDDDNRARTAYGVVGTETFRFNSKIDAFGKGLNLQNIPSGDEE